MKIMHTADLHLRNQNDERWETLLGLTKKAGEKQVDIMAISGDLFDRGVDADNLRADIREVFSGNGFKIVIIPGNHDHQSYRQGIYLGEDTVILNQPGQSFSLGEVTIWALPFHQTGGEEIVRELHSISGSIDSGQTNILLYHGELLDTFYSRRDFGEEGETRYMPAKLSYFEGLNIDYILAGHFHSSFDTRRLGDGGYFVYPGSPVSITTRETGRRGVNLFQPGAPPEKFLLDTPHYEQIEVKLDPLGEGNPSEIVREKLHRMHPMAKAIVNVTGYINSREWGITEKQLVEELKELSREREARINHDFRDVGTILEDDLFRDFNNKLKRRDCSQRRKEQLKEMTIRAMMESQY